MVAVYAKTKDDFSAVAVHRISSSLATPAVEALIINNSQQEQCKATYYIRLPQGRGCYLTVDPRITTVATLKQTISHRCGIPLTLVSLHWQGATLDQWQHSRISLLDIGLISGDTLHLRQPIKGGVQPMTRNQKRTFLLDDSDSEDIPTSRNPDNSDNEEGPTGRKATQTNACLATQRVMIV